VPLDGAAGDGGGATGGARTLLMNGEEAVPTREVDLVNTVGTYLRRDGYAGDCGADSPDGARFDTPAERFGASGVALVSRAETFRRVGLFADRFFAYYEDVDWCWRARLAGLRILYDPAATVRHARGATSGGVSSGWVRHLAERNRISCLWRNAPLPLAAAQTTAKWRGGRADGVVDELARVVAASLAERGSLRRRWALRCGDVYEAWAGVDVPDGPEAR
jgi:hypothetical protein